VSIEDQLIKDDSHAMCVYEINALEAEVRLLRKQLEATRSAAAVWLDPSTVPKDGTLVLLLVQGGESPIADDMEPYVTIGINQADENDNDPTWQVAGWCWSHDHFTECVGAKVLGWMRLPDESLPAAT
jgi:hypothetical protein